MGTIKTTNIEPIADNGTVTLGSSGDTFTIPSGVTMTVPSGGLSGQNYPAFEARLNSSQATDHNTTTKIQCGDEIFDTDSAYDASTNYRFTPQVAGKYFCYGRLAYDKTGDFDNIEIMLQKNGTAFADSISRNEFYNFINTYGIADLNGSSDYVEMYTKQVAGSTSGLLVSNSSGSNCLFGAYRIGA